MPRYVLALLFVCSIQSGISSNLAFARQPNVVVVLTDDQGWGDLGVSGNRNLATPNIDSLAHDGMTLENFYVCQVCAPTRAEFLTGRYYPRTGVSGVSRGQGRLNANETTLADLFKEAGYATGAFGKWHNGTQPPFHPNNRGFSEFYGFTSGHWGHYFSPPLDHNGRRVRGRGFVIDDFTEHALDFIQANRDQPFFCYIPFNTPHSPMMVPDRFYAKFKGRDPSMRHRDPKREDVMMTRAALAMCENIDWNVGRLLKKLEDLKLVENTIVIYFSDNGPNSYRWNGGMKGRKGSIDEGGLRSPCFIRWPKRIRAGSSVSQIAGAIDLLPTLADLADLDGKVEKPLDGRTLRSLLLGEKANWPPRVLYSTRRDKVSVRTQRFRLDSAGRLFDIAADPGQAVNVAASHPKVTATLKKQAEKHAREMMIQFAANAERPFQPETAWNTGRSSGARRRPTIPFSPTGRRKKISSRGISMSAKVATTKRLCITLAPLATKARRCSFLLRAADRWNTRSSKSSTRLCMTNPRNELRNHTILSKTSSRFDLASSD